MCCPSTTLAPVAMPLQASLSLGIPRTLDVPLCIPEQFIPSLLQFVSNTNSDTVIFLGKTYPPRTLRFLNFLTERATAAHFYGKMQLDFEAGKAVGERPFLPLEQYLHG